MKGFFLAMLFFILILATQNIFAFDKIIYGTDDRYDIYKVNDPIIRELARSTAARFDNNQLMKKEDGTYSLMMIRTLQQSINVCSSERFAQQPAMAGCSGFLVGKNLLVTAGHCVLLRGNDYCKNFSWVFDYRMENETTYNSKNISPDNVYTCKRIVKAVQERLLDYAIIELDREVVGRDPLQVNRDDNVQVGDDLYVIGFPSGLPLKVGTMGRVFSTDKEWYFSTNLDTFGGNSGSAVFNKNTHLIEGILVRGKPDYVRKDPNDYSSCRVVNRCNQDRGECLIDSASIDGEHVTKIKFIVPYLE